MLVGMDWSPQFTQNVELNIAWPLKLVGENLIWNIIWFFFYLGRNLRVFSVVKYDSTSNH